MSVVCDRVCRAQLLKFWSNKVMLYYNSDERVVVLLRVAFPAVCCGVGVAWLRVGEEHTLE